MTIQSSTFDVGIERLWQGEPTQPLPTGKEMAPALQAPTTHLDHVQQGTSKKDELWEIQVRVPEVLVPKRWQELLEKGPDAILALSDPKLEGTLQRAAHLLSQESESAQQLAARRLHLFRV